MVTGKNTPPKKFAIPPNMGFRIPPLLNNRIEEAEIIPILEKEIIVKNKITNPAHILALLNLVPKRNVANKRYIITFIETLISFHKFIDKIPEQRIC